MDNGPENAHNLGPLKNALDFLSSGNSGKILIRIIARDNLVVESI